MNHDDYVEKMIVTFGGDREAAESLIWIATGLSNLTQRPFNFVPTEGDLYEIYQPDGRGGFSKAVQLDSTDLSHLTSFVGILSEAYDYVFEDRVEMRKSLPPNWKSMNHRNE